MNSSNYLPEKQEKENPENKKPKSPYLKFSFIITYILLLTTATITFIEALRTNIPIVRHIFNLETCISIVACYFYSLFVGKVEESEKTGIPLDWVDITQMRYIDWCITTPMMLLALMVVLGYNSKTPVHLMTITTVILLNYIMLYLGYLGEVNVISRFNGLISGFIAFFAMFFIIFMNFIKSKSVHINNILFGVYFVVWSIYGIVYMFGEETKNTIMNILDWMKKSLY
jgi:bacteriorhodopsin